MSPSFVGPRLPAKLLHAACAAALCLAASAASARAQQTNPVDRQVTNPMTDKPSVNPLTQEQPVVRPRPRPTPAAGSAQGPAQQPTDVLDVRADRQDISGPEKERVYVYEGNVDARIGIYRLQADKVTVFEAKNLVIAEGSVVFDQGEFQRITGSRAEWNYATKVGYFLNSTGFTNQTLDGTVMYFTADRVDKVSGNKIVVRNAVVTACDEENPKWSFTTRRAVITMNDRVRVRSPFFRIKGVPVFYLPYASVSIKPKDRASGFLTPTFSGSGKKGFRITNGYYQTLGRSADVTIRNDIFTARGLGFGADLRTRANSRSYFDMGFYAIKDRVFGAKASPQNPDQGGSSFYIDGVHYFPNGFMAVADVNITSNLAFRQVFSDTIQDAISPEERSQVFINKNFRDYSFNFLARTQVISIPTARIRLRSLPSISVDKRPSPLSFFKKLPVYFSFESALEGMSRKETIEDLAGFLAEGAPGAIQTPSLVQRLDFKPEVSVPFEFDGWAATATASLRGTFYSNSLDPATRTVTSRNLVRGFGEFRFDLRPPALARNFRNKDGSLRFRHTIEPYFTYRRIAGIDDFERIIRFDQVDAVADTSEIEFGVTNRFFQRRSTETVTGKVRPQGSIYGNERESRALEPQPYEALSITVRQKYFFDPDFGGALIPGRRNQFYPINTFSGFTYGGVPRRFSPLYVEARLRPYRSLESRLRSLTADVRANFDVLGTGGGLRDLAVTFSLDRRVPKLRLLRAFQTFYYTRAVTLAPSLRQFSDVRGNEPGTLQGSQWSPTVFVGDPDRGLFGGVSFFFDFQNRPGKGSSSLISSTTTVGYTWDCCSITAQNYTFNVGLRQENRIVFSFRLNGIGTFGTEQIGQHFR
jgi:LPS-assembly protein